MADAAPYSFTLPWSYHELRDAAGISSASVRDADGRMVLALERPEPHEVQLLRQIAALPQLIGATRNLVGSDNCNYDRHLMRYEGYFDQARAALEAATGEHLPHPSGAQAGKSIIAIVEEREARMAALETALGALLDRCEDLDVDHADWLALLDTGRAALAFDPNRD